MRKLLNLCALSLVLLGALSCQKKENPLEITISPETVYLIDATAKSCVDIATSSDSSSISGLFMRFRSVRLDWRGKKQLGLSYLRITASGTNIADTFTCTIAGEELEYLFNISQDTLIAPGTYKKGPDDSGTKCKLTCGGLKLIDDKLPATLTGQIEAVGYALDSESETPVHATANFAIRSQ